MLSGGTLVLSALVLIQAETQFDVGGRFESRVGQAPTGVAENSDGNTVPAQQGQALLIATPTLSFRYLSDVDELRAVSFTRALWRPQPLLHARPLFLETLELSEIGRLSARSRWRLNLRGAYGEEDYTTLSQQFVGQPTLPSALTVLLLNADGEASWRATRRTEVTLQALAIYRRTVDTQSPLTPSTGTAAPGFIFPPQATLSLAPGVRHLLSRRTTVEALVAVMDTDIGATTQGSTETGRLNVFSIQPQVGIRQQLSPSHQLHVAAGVAYAVALRRSNGSQSWPPFLPLVQLDLTSYLRRSRDMQWRSTLGAATNAFADPVLGTEVLRGTAQARLDVDVGPNWGVSALAVFATDITGPLQAIGSQQAGQGPPALAPDETVVSAEIPVHYRWPNQFLVEVGGRFSQRAPHLRSPTFAWRETSRELWMFLSLSTLAPVARRPSTPAVNASRVNGSTASEPPTTRPPAPPPVPSPL
jgi:hypothetical protein